MSALTPEQTKIFVQSVVDSGAEHDEGCPCDDTCECSCKPLNDAINAVCHAIETELPSLRAQLQAREQENETLRSTIKGLAAGWREEALKHVPESYSARGLGYKYLKQDNWAAGIDECADDVDIALAALTPSVPPQTTAENTGATK